MRHQGKISNWRDDQGYGFLTPDQGDQKVFFHIKALSDRQRRPSLNDRVSYEISHDQRSRPQAVKLAFDVERAAARAPAHTALNPLPLLIAGGFLAFVAAGALIGKVPASIFALYLALSAITFMAYASDKSAARADRRRLPENTLHLLALIGGWPGALIAQNRLRHKSRKTSFLVVFWATMLLNCGALGLLLAPAGGKALRAMLG